jgi:hypothetical protein
MKGLKVKCPNCTRISLETTDQFNPNVPPHGGMVKFLLQYHIDWLCVPTTKASEMCCPECLAPLVVGGVLNVILPPRNIGEYFEQETEEADRVAKEASVAANKVLDKGIIDGKPDNEIINDMAAAVNKVIDDSLKDAIPAFICDVCGKECKSELGLKSHKRSHK